MKKLKRKIINYLLKHYLTAVVIEDVVTENTAKQLMINGVVPRSDELKSIKVEAKYILESKTWALLTNTLKSQAQKKIFEKALSFDDCTSGKTMLYNLDVQDKILKKLST